jgi:hypothetical protein
MRPVVIFFGSLLATVVLAGVTDAAWPGQVWLAFLGVWGVMGVVRYRRDERNEAARREGARREAAVAEFAASPDPAELIAGTLADAESLHRRGLQTCDSVLVNVVTREGLVDLGKDLAAFPRSGAATVDRLMDARLLHARAQALDAEAKGKRTDQRRTFVIALATFLGMSSQ